jgi:predicted oxidoreductase (fatty acid repression mutant protein)
MAAPQTEVYTVWCVLADEPNLFSIKIESSESVDDLKKKIYEANKNTPAFAEIAARHLKLYHVEISDLEDMAKDELEKAVTQKLAEHPAELGPKKKLANIFNGGPKDETLIIVQSPTSGK